LHRFADSYRSISKSWKIRDSFGHWLSGNNWSGRFLFFDQTNWVFFMLMDEFNGIKMLVLGYHWLAGGIGTMVNNPWVLKRSRRRLSNEHKLILN
jgi:hypothetical protein